jgi:hypothetical protein
LSPAALSAGIGASTPSPASDVHQQPRPSSSYYCQTPTVGSHFFSNPAPINKLPCSSSSSFSGARMTVGTQSKAHGHIGDVICQKTKILEKLFYKNDIKNSMQQKIL